MTDFPVSISPEAIVQARRVLERQGAASSFVRLGVKGGGCSGLEYVIRIDAEPRPLDLQTEVDGIRFLCDPKSAVYLSGATLRYTGNLIGGGFTFDNPNAGRSCGCGTSFMPKKAT